MQLKLQFRIVVYLLCAVIWTSLAHAATKKRNPNQCEPTNSTRPPVLKVVLKPIKTQPFILPNGLPIDMNADVQSMLNTVVTSTESFSPTDPSEVTNPCENHIEIRSAITTFQLDVAEVGVSFGYTPSGVVVPGLGGIQVGADAKVIIGMIAMDFSVWQCQSGKCSSVAASTATHLTSGVNANIGLRFSVISAGPSLVYNSPIGDILRKIMHQGVEKISNSSRLQELTWTSTVRQVMPEIGTLIFDGGTQTRVMPNQKFIIYAALDPSATGACQVYEPVAMVHTTSVYPVSSIAIIDQSLNTRGVKVGDVVMVYQSNGH